MIYGQPYSEHCRLAEERTRRIEGERAKTSKQKSATGDNADKSVQRRDQIGEERYQVHRRTQGYVKG
ncbi:MAG: hypothetical protein GY804_02465 [Alphaproteobacteria bacterium]|nr:hypothetical protein [Alphaproteobacteria bacterium]